MQSGTGNASEWRICWTGDLKRWEGDLMGWTSSRDPVQGLFIRFGSKESAIEYAEKHDWPYDVDDEPEKIPPRSKSYGDNFTYSKGKLKYIFTK